MRHRYVLSAATTYVREMILDLPVNFQPLRA